MPGTVRGTLKEEIGRETGLGPVDIIAVGSHDTASAVAAVPATEGQVAFLSSGTWSLLGVEVDEPILTEEAMIAAIYVVLTYVFAPFSFGEVQIRIAEALTILPVFTPAAIPGLFVGCIVGNILGGAILPDIIFGSIATLIGAFFTYQLRNKNRFLAPLPPIIANTVIVPFVLRYGYGVALPIPFMMLTVGVGEVVGCGVLGLVLYTALNRYKNVIFKTA